MRGSLSDLKSGRKLDAPKLDMSAHGMPPTTSKGLQRQGQVTLPSPKRSAQATAATPVTILGPHPPAGTWTGDLWDHADSQPPVQPAHRVLSTRPQAFPNAIAPIQGALERHHADAAQLASSAAQQRSFKNLGLSIPKALRRFPINSETRKGNFAEIVLAEYILATSKATLPVYRLRHNPNVDQSMKGDDVLAFDLDATPVRIIVGEAKFRSKSANKVISEIVEALEKSHAAGVPASLQFAADHADDPRIGARIMACAGLFAEGKIRVDHIGLLVSDADAAGRVSSQASKKLHRLLVISWGMDHPDLLVDACFNGLG